MSVLLFVQGDITAIGGMEEHGWAMVEWMAKNGVEHQIIRFNSEQNGEPQFQVEGIGSMNLSEMKQKLSCKVLFHNTGHLIEQFAKLKEAFPESIQVYRTGGNEVLQARLQNESLSHHERQMFWVDSINESIDVLVSNSEFTEFRYENLGISRKLFLRAVGGTNPPLPNQKPTNSDDELILFCAARFVTYKNHYTLVDLMGKLIQNGFRVKLYLAGGGPLLDNVKSQVKSMHLSNNVVFLGEISPEEVTKFLSRTDVYIQLSIEENRVVEGGSYIHTEGMGRSVLAAISSGTWIIAGNAGALPEIVYGARGVTVNPHNADHAMQALNQWLGNGCLRTEQTEEYSWDNYFEKYKSFIEVKY